MFQNDRVSSLTMTTTTGPTDVSKFDRFKTTIGPTDASKMDRFKTTVGPTDISKFDHLIAAPLLPRPHHNQVN
jgi:hypothetical protein